MLLSWSHPVLFLPSRLFLFNPLIPLLYADMAYQSIGKGVRRLNQLCAASGNLADSSCVSIGRGSARSVSALLHTHRTFLRLVMEHHGHYCYKLFQNFMELRATEKGRNQEAERDEFSSLTSSLKLPVSCQNWEMEIAGEGRATRQVHQQMGQPRDSRSAKSL